MHVVGLNRGLYAPTSIHSKHEKEVIYICATDDIHIVGILPGDTITYTELGANPLLKERE